MRSLSPSLETIARQLFRPSDELLQRAASEDRTVPPAERGALDSDPEARQVIAELRAAELSQGIEQAGLAGARMDVPPHLADLFRRRVAAGAHRFSRLPTPGQILSIERVIGPDGDLDWDLSRPLAVLLDEPGRDKWLKPSPEIWQGWMVAPETDYAAYWDFVFQEEDGPFDPLVGMAQVWNPVLVYLKSTNAVLGELTPARLQAVRALADEYLTAPEPDSAGARPGFIASRITLGGLPIVTGTPLSGSSDPRWRYQEIYHIASEALRAPARMAQEVRRKKSRPEDSQAREGFFSSIISRAVALHMAIGQPRGIDAIAAFVSKADWLKTLFRGFDLVPVHRGATLNNDFAENGHLQTESTAESPDIFKIGDLLEVSGNLRTDGTRQLKVRLLTDIELAVVVREAEGGIERCPLGPEQREATFELSSDRLYSLEILDSVGRPLQMK